MDFLVIVKSWEMVCGKNVTAKDQLGELGILGKEKMLDQFSGWLKVKCVSRSGLFTGISMMETFVSILFTLTPCYIP